jgi:3-methyladenine DNA glycosylase/8-oxoguanine DNA glycosylase
VALDAGADRDKAARQLARIPGVGARTVARIRMRALGDPDVFIPASAGLTEKRAEPWRPWRSYALQYLWSAPSGTQ